MVRLKDQKVSSQLQNIFISIPYGAIKRITKKVLIIFCIISIPYGAIKSTHSFAKNVYDGGISIPYGAIKSVLMNVEYSERILFQFLMVRLKAWVNIRLQIVNSNFNSLWCD